MPPARTLDQQVERQMGIVSRAQVLADGRTRDWLRARLASGQRQRLFVGTYATFWGPVSREARISAAVLRAGPGAMAAEESALELYGIGLNPGKLPVTVLVPHHRRVSLESSIRVRTSRYADQRQHPLWRPSRAYLEDAVLDIADRCTRLNDVTGWITRATASGKTTPGRIADALGLRQRHRWSGVLGQMLADIAEGAESPLERAYLQNVERAHRLPTARRQRAVRGGTVRFRLIDIDYEPFGTRVELDGRVGHEGDGAFRDRLRDNASSVEGFATLRYGWGEVIDHPCSVAAEVARLLERGGWPGPPARCGAACRLPRTG